MRKIIDYLAEVKAEMTKVTWPKRQEVVRLTIIVLAISVAVGIFVGVLDFIFTKLLSLVVIR